MNTNLIIQNDKPADELIVIPDECGDSLWDAVLEQEVKSGDVKTVSKNAASLLNSIDAVQESIPSSASLVGTGATKA